MTRHDTRNFRPNPDYYLPVESAAGEAGVSMNVLLQALLREFLTDPAGRLAALAPHLEAVAAETPRRGRPAAAARPAQ
ncbi:MAG: hypothetical protein V7603_5043 [Micromonosporaceae bacterium]